MAATLFAFSAFLADYAQETRMYALMALLGLSRTTGFVRASCSARRKYVICSRSAQSLMLYTHNWGVLRRRLGAHRPCSWRISDDVAS